MPARPRANTVPDPDRVREKLVRLLALTKAADTMPWDEKKARMWRIVFPDFGN